MSQLLLVEQDSILRSQYELALSRTFAVVPVESAQAAIDVLDEQSTIIDGLVTDINIDSNNGIELLYELRSYDDWLQIPIVILSSVPRSRFTHIDFSRYGVRDFVYKPMVTPAEVLRRVQLALEVYEARTD